MRNDRTEESVIDLIIISADLIKDVKTVIVDERREHVLTKITKSKGIVTVVESDHNPIISELNLKHNRKIQIDVRKVDR